MTTYHGWRDANRTAHVEVIPATGGGSKRELPLRLDLENHSPTGLEWGYGGSGPAQLALALLSDATGDDELAVKLHQQFKWCFVTPLDRDNEWYVSADSVRNIVAVLLTQARVDEAQEKEQA